MRWKATPLAAVAALVALASACGDGGTEPPAACTGPVAVSVSGGTTPTITWAPPCGVGYVTVRRPLPPSLGGLQVEPQWTIRSEGRLVGPPVRYGVRPLGIAQVVAPQQLVAGQPYGIVVDVNGSGVLGSHVFIP